MRVWKSGASTMAFSRLAVQYFGTRRRSARSSFVIFGLRGWAVRPRQSSRSPPPPEINVGRNGIASAKLVEAEGGEGV